jgi:hypothetical protein
MWPAKVYKKTKTIETPLATVQIESEVYVEKPPTRSEGPPRWLTEAELARNNPEQEKKSMQQQHLDHLFQLGQQYTQGTKKETKEPLTTTKGTRPTPIVGDIISWSDEKNVVAAVSARQQVGKEQVGLHRAVSTRRVANADSTRTKQGQTREAPELPKIQEEDKYLGITFRDISNKLFAGTITGTIESAEECCGVEETKLPEAESMEMEIPILEKEHQTNLAGFSIGNVFSKNLFQGMPFYKSNNDDKPVTEKRKAPYFTDAMFQKQNDDIAPVKEIKILHDTSQWSCHDELMPHDEEQGYLRRLHSDDMSCVTIPNMIQS